jgi:alpha-tubulin suppressor-like RCC1 family protein
VANTAASSTPSLYAYKNFEEIGCSIRTVHALDETGQLWAWGSNVYGQLGDDTTIARSSPVQIASGTSFLKMSRSPDSYNPHAIASNGSLTSIGGGYNLTGNSSITNFRSSPVVVSPVAESNWLSVTGSLYLITGLRSNDV